MQIPACRILFCLVIVSLLPYSKLTYYQDQKEVADVGVALEYATTAVAGL